MVSIRIAHNQMWFSQFLVILLFLSACSLTHAVGSEKGLQVKKTVSESKSTPNSSTRILVIGDSISAGFGIDKNLGWVNLLDQELGESVSFINASISGDTSTGGRYRIAKALSDHQPDIVVIELGGNDGLRGTPIKLIEKNLLEMAMSAQKHGAAVIIAGMQIPPNYGARYTEAFKNMYANVAEKTSSSLIPFFLEGVAGVDGMMQDDGIHPTAPAQSIMSEHVKKILETLLELRS